jgi:hypothetical protein
MNWNEKTKLVQKDPVTCSRFFDHRVQQFIKKIKLTADRKIMFPPLFITTYIALITFSEWRFLQTLKLPARKIILHLKATTPNCMIYGELGRYPLDIDIKLIRNILYCILKCTCIFLFFSFFVSGRRIYISAATLVFWSLCMFYCYNSCNLFNKYCLH